MFYDKEIGYENVATLVHTIPIYLREKKPERKDEEGIIDLLGAYYPNSKGGSPYIELFLTPIDASSNGDDDQFRWLFTKVLIHELAHAALDIFNCIRYHKNGYTEKVHYYTEFGKWREESMANAVALRIIKESRDTVFYDYAKYFMLSQPKEYALGALMENFGYWDFRSVFDTKVRGVNSVLQQEWLNYVQNTPDWKGLHNWNDLLKSSYVYSFMGKYYTSEEELVYDIVNKVLSDYENNKGVKMSYGIFSSLFPYIKTGAEMSYEPSEKVKDDSGYSHEISLLEGNYSLYYYWDNKTLHKFVNQSGCVFEEYNNWA